MNGWYRAKAQADGRVLPVDAKTQYEKYPQLNSIEQNESIALLKARLELLEARTEALERKPGV